MVACCSSSAEATVDKVVAGCLLLVAGAKAESMVNKVPLPGRARGGFFWLHVPSFMFRWRQFVIGAT